MPHALTLTRNGSGVVDSWTLSACLMLTRLIRGFALGGLWLYKRSLSPAFYFLGARCRHSPTCSEYAADAFRRHKPGRAFWLSLSRLTRCHPWGSHGFDPVPDNAVSVGWRFWKLGDWAWTERCGDQCDLENTSENPPSSPSSTRTTSA